MDVTWVNAYNKLIETNKYFCKFLLNDKYWIDC